MPTAADRLKAVFDVAAEAPDPAARAELLDRECGGDAALRERVEALLRAHDMAGSFLALPAGAVLDETVGHAPEDGSTTDRSAAGEGLGAVVGPYKLLEQLGEGGFGVVYLAEQTQPVRRKVALKVLKPGMDTRQVVARFEAERQALAIMDHPSIARVFDGGTTPSGRPYFVMELVRGVPITDFCDRNHLPTRQRLELFLAVLSAVQHAHQKGIIHRDLKPSNVLVSRFDTAPVVKVIDFGIAKALGQTLTEKTLFTGAAQMVGTPLYMSPEQAGMSDLDVDTRSDVYSLGVLLYELLTGTTPFTKDRFRKAAYDEIRRIIREEEPPRPSTRLSESKDSLPSVAAQRQTEPARLTRLVRGELDWIVMKALEKDRNRRFETANGFAMDVQRYLADEPVIACPPSARYRLGKFARRNKGRLAVAAVVLLLLAALGGVAGWAALQHAARRAALTTDIGRDLEAARDFCRQDRLREASAVLDHAEALAARGGADADSGGRVAQVRKDVDMASRLESIRLARARAVKGERFDWEGAALRYTEAFRDYGLDLDLLEPDQVGARIEVSPIREQLVAALDDGLLAPSGSNRERLAAVLVRADADPWRQRVRAALVEGNQKALRALVGEANASGQPPSAAVLMGKGLHDLGEAGLAVEFLRRAQQEHPSDLWLNLVLGMYLFQLRPAQAGEAGGYLRAALALRPDSPGVLYELGMTLGCQDDLPGAIAAYQKAIALQPDVALFHFALGQVFWKQGDLRGAVAAYQKASALRPDLAKFHFALGEAFEKQGDLPGAVAAYQKTIAITPSYAPVYVALGRALAGQGDLPGTVAAYQKAVALVPRYAQELQPDMVPARYYLHRNQLDKAAAEYAKVDLWARPLREDAYACACLFLIRGEDEGYDRFCQGMIQRVVQRETPGEAYILARCCATGRRSAVDPARVVQWANQVIASDHQPWHFHVLGLAQYRAGQFDQALQSFTKANVDAWKYRELNWFGLALVHHHLGDPEEARQCLAKGIQWLDRESPPGPDQPARLLPQDWLEAKILRREAEELLKINQGP
jgi:serine/threonine protein kinase/tetratricopeptide (TPR) repeat protein